MASKEKPDSTPRPFGRALWLPWASMLSDAARIRFELLAELHAMTEDAINGRTAEIDRTYREAESDSSRDRNEVEGYGEYLAEELRQLEDIKRSIAPTHGVSLPPSRK
jgi:hypothetical protein